MMIRRCSYSKCHVDEGETCSLGAGKPEDCDSWKAGLSDALQTQFIADSSEARVPWSGSSLGTDDLLLLLPRAKRVIVGVLGAHDVGKTTLLTANYLLLLRGHKIAQGTFAGSRTLSAWEALASWMRFHDSAMSPMFPPHTPRGSGRVPGLLHMALRNSSGEFRDILLADAPGEWFTKWAINEDSSQAEGAKWIAEHSDGFLIIADCQRLASNQRGVARADLLQLIDRLSNHIKSRPVGLVWTKSEYSVPDNIEKTIRKALMEALPGAVEFHVTISNPLTMSEPIENVVSRTWHSVTAPPVVPPVKEDDVFLAFRGHGDFT